MELEDRKYLAYLTSWAVDRIITTIMNSIPESNFNRECTYTEIREQAEMLFQNFQIPEDQYHANRLRIRH